MNVVVILLDFCLHVMVEPQPIFYKDSEFSDKWCAMSADLIKFA